MAGICSCHDRNAVQLMPVADGRDWRARLPVRFFFFKQQTAYEISECDWSSDVCSSDLIFIHKQKTAYEISECDWSSDRKSVTSELQSHSEISYAVFCLKKKNNPLLTINVTMSDKKSKNVYSRVNS